MLHWSYVHGRSFSVVELWAAQGNTQEATKLKGGRVAFKVELAT
mgnify:CR=1 FL=1